MVEPEGFKSQAATGNAPLIAPDWWRLYRDPELDRAGSRPRPESEPDPEDGRGRVDQASTCPRGGQLSRSDHLPGSTSGFARARSRDARQRRHGSTGAERRHGITIGWSRPTSRMSSTSGAATGVRSSPRTGSGRRQCRRRGDGSADGADRRRAVLLHPPSARCRGRDAGADRRLVSGAGIRLLSVQRGNRSCRARSGSLTRLRGPARGHAVATTRRPARPRRSGTRPGDLGAGNPRPRLLSRPTRCETRRRPTCRPGCRRRPGAGRGGRMSPRPSETVVAANAQIGVATADLFLLVFARDRAPGSRSGSLRTLFDWGEPPGVDRSRRPTCPSSRGGGSVRTSRRRKRSTGRPSLCTSTRC